VSEREGAFAALNGLMMDRPLLLKTLLWRAEQVFGDNEIVWAEAGAVERYTYADYGRRVRSLAGALRSMGVAIGDRVGSLAWNTARHFEAYYAVPCMGAVLHTINLRLSPEQLAFTIRRARDKVLLVDPDQLPVVEAIWGRLDSVEAIVVLADQAPPSSLPVIAYDDLIACSQPMAEFPELDEQAAAAICFTSATTGDPKGVVYSHRSMVLHSLVASVHGSFGVREDMCLLAISPMFHANSWGLPHAAAMQGSKIVFPGAHPAPDTYLELVQRERVTHAYAAVTVGLQLRQLLEASPDRFDVSSLGVLLLGGQAPPRDLMEFFDGRGIYVPQAWGMTEASPLATWNYLRPRLKGVDRETHYRIRGRQGIPLPLMEVKIDDDAGGERPWDGTSAGEIMLRSPWVAKGYLDDPARSAEAQHDGWFRTGDLGTVDHDGYVHVMDRAKDLIKSGGEWISSTELEDALMAHPKVAEAAVVAIPDPRWLERPLACVVARDPEDPPSLAELATHLTPRFAKWWLPDRYELLSEIPKTSVGKYDKKALRSRFAQEIL
jgi:fatty-acyl-CoA synthase